MNNLKIHDIKNLSEVSDWSFYIFLILLICLLVIIIFLTYLIVSKIKNKKINIQKFTLEKLKEVNTNQSKNAAYEITKYLHLLKKNELQTQLANELILDLENYKYKKVTSGFNHITTTRLKKFMESL